MLRGLDRGNEPEHDPGQERQTRRERHDRPLNGDIGGARQAGHRRRGEERNGPRSQKQTGHASGRRQHQALDDQLADDAQPARAKSDADGDFLLTIDGAHEQQVCDIRAPDQEHERDGPRQQSKCRAHILYELILRPRHQRPAVPVRLGELRLELSCDGVHLHPRLLERHAGLQPRDGEDAGMPATILRQRGRPRTESDIDVRRLKELESRGQDADHRVRPVVEQERSTDRIAARKSPLREARAQNRQVFSARPILAVGEVAASFDGYAKQRQQCGGDHLRRDPLGIARARHRHARGAKRRHSGERLRPRAPVVIVVARHRQGRELGRLLVEDDDIVWPVVRQRREQYRVGDGEDRGVRADAERQREDGDRRKHRSTDQIPESESRVLHRESLRRCP